MPTISSLNHVLLPSNDIEEILDIELGTESTPTIRMMNHTTSLPSPFNSNQFTLRNSHCQALYHLDDTAPFHVSNNRSDFIRFSSHHSTISLHNYLPLSCEGIGTIMTRSPDSKQPIILTPVYNCPQATSSILSLSALIQYNKHFTITVDPDTSLHFCPTDHTPLYSLPIICYENTQYVSLPVFYLCETNIIHETHQLQHFSSDEDDISPTLAAMTTTLATYDPFLHPVVTTQGQVNIHNINEVQRSILVSYPPSFFRQHRTAVFQLDSSANDHATNNCQDFIVFHKIQTDIHLAVGSVAQCEGIGAILTKLTPDTNPVLLAPVYYCPIYQR